MKQSWTFRCYPTLQQAQHLTRTFGCCRFVYNWALATRTKAFKDGGRMNYAQSSAALTALKQQPDFLWLNEVSSVPLQQALRHLQSAFVNFFEKRAGYPAFRKKNGPQSVEYTRSAFRFDAMNRRLELAKLGRLKVKWSRPIDREPTTITVVRRPSGRYFVSLVVDAPDVQLAKTGQSVAIDFGVARLATLSTGQRIANPRYGMRYQRRIAFLQRQVARKRKGSRRRALALRKIARLHEKIADCRADVLKKLASSLVRRFDMICVEDLNLRGMVKNHSLARSLNDAGIGTAIRTIEQKAAMHGKTVVKIDRWFPSSKMCGKCGAINTELKLSDRTWRCECGAVHDRDENAARNILAAGQAVTAHGAGVRAKRDTSRKAGLRRSANQLKLLA